MLAVLLAQAVEVGGVYGVVRHPREVRLGQINGAASRNGREEVGKSGQVSSLAMLPGFRIWTSGGLIERSASLLPRLLQILVYLATGFARLGGCFIHDF